MFTKTQFNGMTYSGGCGKGSSPPCSSSLVKNGSRVAGETEADQEQISQGADGEVPGGVRPARCGAE